VAVAFDIYNKSQGRPSLIAFLTRRRGAKTTGDAPEMPSAATETSRIDETLGQSS
jgi:putative multiple sugar transport system permease protein